MKSVHFGRYTLRFWFERLSFAIGRIPWTQYHLQRILSTDTFNQFDLMNSSGNLPISNVHLWRDVTFLACEHFENSIAPTIVGWMVRTAGM